MGWLYQQKLILRNLSPLLVGAPQGIPGVGPERACVLLDKFGSVEAILTASMEELVSIKGIGANTVDTIHWAVREAGAEYDSSLLDTDPIL